MRTIRSSGGVSPLGGLSALLGVSAIGGVSVPGGVCSWGGICSREGCLLQGGVCSQGKGVSALGECLLLGGCLLRGLFVSHHALRQTPPCGQTDTCKNITFATSLRTVTKETTQPANYVHAVFNETLGQYLEQFWLVFYRKWIGYHFVSNLAIGEWGVEVVGAWVKGKTELHFTLKQSYV